MKKILSSILMYAVVLTTTAFMLPTVGCSSTEVVSEVNIVLTEATNILTVADPTAPFVPQLKAAIAALQTAETTWQSGGAVTGVEDALNTIVAITAAIPLTAAYSPLIDVLVAGIEAILAALPPVATVGVAASSSNPHVGRVVIKHHLMHNRVDEFKAAWNAAAKQTGLVNATL